MADCWNVQKVINVLPLDAPAIRERPDVIVIVPCSVEKLPVPAPAADFYTGPFHRACMDYARSVVPITQILILSAKYGLVTPFERIWPYDLTMKQAGAASGTRIHAQAIELCIAGRPVLALGGRRYTERIAGAVPRTLTIQQLLKPGRMGIGYQLQWLKNNRGRLPEQLKELT